MELRDELYGHCLILSERRIVVCQIDGWKSPSLPDSCKSPASTSFPMQEALPISPDQTIPHALRVRMVHQESFDQVRTVPQRDFLNAVLQHCRLFGLVYAWLSQCA